MERGETPEAAASRKLVEETGVIVPANEMTLVSVSSILHMAQTHLVFRCHLDERPATTTTEEARECAWFSDADLPADDLAFTPIADLTGTGRRYLHFVPIGLSGASLCRTEIVRTSSEQHQQ
jgi:ADP-ribose pyrophosphatase YjhB (NUDIX family)